MFGLDRLLQSRRRGADSGAVRARIEPTLAPHDGLVRVKLRFNDNFATAITEHQEALYGLSVADIWRDCVGDAAGRDVIIEVPVPSFATPGKSVMRTGREWHDAAPTPPPADSGSASTPTPEPAIEPPPAVSQQGTDAVSTPVRFGQPTLSPTEHAERLLAWCRRRGLTGEVIIFDMERAYSAMCAEERIRPRPWNPVSRELTKIITGTVGVKHYTTSHESDGAHKRRVFRIPALQSGLPAGPQSRPHEAAGEPMRAAA